MNFLDFKTNLVKFKNHNISRNNQGRITLTGRSLGSKKLFRVVDFFRNKNDTGIILKVEKDPIRTGFLGLILYKNGLLSYVLLSSSLNVGEFIFSGKNMFSNLLDSKTFSFNGSSSELQFFKLGSIVNSLELLPNTGAKYVRTAGNFAKIFKKTFSGKVFLKLKSGWKLIVSNRSIATLGTVSNSQNWYKSLKKAGISRKLGFRPSVRGVAKNPVDHPHGGGEGKSSGGRVSVTPWGLITKGQPTVSKRYRKHRNFRVFR